MKDIGILDGDLLAVHKTQDVRNGQGWLSRVSMKESDGEAPEKAGQCR